MITDDICTRWEKAEPVRYGSRAVGNPMVVQHSRVTEAARPDVMDSCRASGFRVELICDWHLARARWSTSDPPTPFQDVRWLDAWYGAFRGVEPLIAVISDTATAERVALLPLVRRRLGALRIIEFADLDLTDFNAPLLGPAAPRDAAGAQLMWRELLSALKRMTGGADLLRLRKLPFDLAGQPNPFALLKGTSTCAVNGNELVTGEDFETWRNSLKKDLRKQLDRSWRAFARYPRAAFQIVTEEAAARATLAAMEAQQLARMRYLGLSFVPDEETYTTLYRRLVADDLGSGYATLSALTVGEEVVATLLGIRAGSRYVMLRMSNAGEKWSHCSPGRLVITRTMAALHAQGVRVFDFSTGNYAYKRRLGAVRRPLFNLTAPLSWRGMPLALRENIVRRIRRYPRFASRISRALGKRSAREED
jgi:CelD/BcsL family acetyltransferase involved in cellulose biosynthesis